MTGAIPPLGTLNDRVQLKVKATTGEAEGGRSIVFVPLATVWARVRSVSARQGLDGDGRGVTVSHAVVMRYRNDVGPGDRIVYRGRTLDVVSAADLNGRRAYLSCTCSEAAVTG